MYETVGSQKTHLDLAKSSQLHSIYLFIYRAAP
jgi:hypothetical protein